MGNIFLLYLTLESSSKVRNSALKVIWNESTVNLQGVSFNVGLVTDTLVNDNLFYPWGWGLINFLKPRLIWWMWSYSRVDLYENRKDNVVEYFILYVFTFPMDEFAWMTLQWHHKSLAQWRHCKRWNVITNIWSLLNLYSSILIHLMPNCILKLKY